MKKLLASCLLVIIILSGFALAAVFTLKSLKTNPAEKILQTPKEVMNNGTILYDEQIAKSLDNEHYTFVNFQGKGYWYSKLWTMDKYGENLTLIDEAQSYAMITSPTFNPTGDKIAYMKVYPFEIWISSLDGKDKTRIYSETEQDKIAKGSGLLNPTMSYGGKVYLKWLANDEITFENFKEYPVQIYKINVSSKIISKIGDSVQTGDKNNYSGDPEKFSQRSDLWSEKTLGTCEGVTIGSAGCAITAIAMLLDYYDKNTDPEILNQWLIENDGYFEGCDIRWNMPALYYKNIKLIGVYFNTHNEDMLKYYLDKNTPVIVGWNRVAFTPVQHWVLVTRYETNLDGEITYYTNDPWTGEEKPISYFGNAFDHMVVYAAI